MSSQHTNLWSCIRYGFVKTAHKQNVDETPYIWSAGGSWPTGLVREGTSEHAMLWRAAQRPWTAASQEARTAQAQKAKVVGERRAAPNRAGCARFAQKVLARIGAADFFLQSRHTPQWTTTDLRLTPPACN